MATVLLTLFGITVVVKSVEFVLRGGRHDCKRKLAERTVRNALANSWKRSVLAVWGCVSAASWSRYGETSKSLGRVGRRSSERIRYVRRSDWND